MDHRFREDENELPYLVNLKRDKVKGSRRDTRSDHEKVEDIVNGLDVSDLEKFMLKNKIMEFLKTMDCTGLYAEDHFTGGSFTFTRENDYVKTCDEFLFDHKFFNGRRLFMDCYTTHYHDRLLSHPKFQKLIDSMPYEFTGVSGGYEIKYHGGDETFEMLDEINVQVSFRVDSKTKRLYKLDLDNMKLEDKYFEVRI